MVTSFEIKQKAAETGYASCGIIPAAVFNEYKNYLSERIGKFPDSKELYEPFYKYAEPPGNGRSIIVCVRSQTRYKIPKNLIGRVGKNYLFDDRIRYSPDYRGREEFDAWLGLSGLNIIDYLPPSRWAAVKAGLGKFGRNNFFYHPEHGSYVKIKTWLVDKELDYDEAPDEIYLSGCEKCGKCIKSCPTNAVTGGFSMDIKKCVTHLTTNSKEAPGEALKSKMGTWLYGCDACQDVCPYNKNKFTETDEYPLLSQFEEYLKPENILEMDEDTYINIIFPRFGYAGKDGLRLWKLNALRAMINSGGEK